MLILYILQSARGGGGSSFRDEPTSAPAGLIRPRSLGGFQEENGLLDPSRNDSSSRQYIYAEDKLPTKSIPFDHELQIRAPIKFIDFEGRSDGRSIKAILAHVSPRKMVLVHGPAAAANHLREYCSAKNICGANAVLFPQLNECLDVTSDTNIYRVRLKDSLLKQAEREFVSVGEYEVAYVTGAILPVASRPADPSMAVGIELQLEPTSIDLPHSSVFVGDVKLTDFKELLSNAGYRTEFAGAGALVCNNVVMLRKEILDTASGRSKVTLTGTLCADYFAIRDLLYNQLHLI